MEEKKEQTPYERAKELISKCVMLMEISTDKPPLEPSETFENLLETALAELQQVKKSLSESEQKEIGVLIRDLMEQRTEFHQRRSEQHLPHRKTFVK